MSRWLEDAGERLQFQLAALWAFGACTVFAVMVSYYLVSMRHAGWLVVTGVLLLGWLVAGGIVLVVWTVSGVAGRALVRTMTGAGNLASTPTYSLQDSLIIRGKYEEARAAYEAHLRSAPGDLNARLALARLWRDQLANPARAEQLYLEVRGLQPTPDQEFAIGNALIDLYRTSGQAGREMAELARFAARFADTDAGARARAALLRLKARES